MRNIIANLSVLFRFRCHTCKGRKHMRKRDAGRRFKRNCVKCNTFPVVRNLERALYLESHTTIELLSGTQGVSNEQA